MNISPSQRRVWAEIDLDAAKYNFHLVRDQLGKDTKTCCVIKANAYGHGAVELARLYEKEGADWFAVSNIEEALQLRHADIQLPILILGYTDPQCASQLVRHRISQCVFSKAYGEQLSACAVEQRVEVNVHIKLDTGMGRIGFACLSESHHELDQVVEICKLPGLFAEGIFTHFAAADEGEQGKAYTEGQYRAFQYALTQLKKRGVSFPIRHCANSADIFDYPEMQLDMVRAGIVLYGVYPSEVMRNTPSLKPLLSLKTVITHLKTVKAGEAISYGREFVADREMQVATLPIGYADGFWRSNFPSGGQVLINGREAPIVGRICMDQCMVDVSGLGELTVGTEVVVYGSESPCTVGEIAKRNGTINYEILCAIGQRVPRVYYSENKIVKIVDFVLKNDGDFEI